MKELKKVLKIAAVNIILLSVILLCSEYIIYRHALETHKKAYEHILNHMKPPGFLQCYGAPFQPQTIQSLKTDKYLLIRPFATKPEYTKKPILIFGCSFANGGGLLEDEQTVGFKLSKYTERNVYNFGICACGIQHMLYIIQNRLSKYINSEKQIPEYAIYIYIPNHIQRLRTNVFTSIFYNGTSLQYELKDNELKIKDKSTSFIYRLLTLKLIYYFFDKKRAENTAKNRYDNFIIANELFLASRKELEKKYPGIKFVILNYQLENDDTYREAPFMFDVLRNEGFIVINSEDLIGRKFKYNSEDTVADRYHPSEHAWDLLIPELSKALNL